MRAILMVLVAGVMFWITAAVAGAPPRRWVKAWPQTDFSRTSVDFDEIQSGGVPRDGIPAIDDPVFLPVSEVTHLADSEPVISLVIEGDARAYPLQVLIWHEIVNDLVGGVPVSVTFCPLCNAAVAFDRRVGPRVLDFGTTGKLRKSDLVMYDRQTESWWQQFTGTAIVGALTGKMLKILPARLESFARFRARFATGYVLVPRNPRGRAYGRNPYQGYDRSRRPFLYQGSMPDAVAPLARVVSVGGRAWSLNYIRKRGRLDIGDGVTITWTAGQNSALDAARIKSGRDVGNVVVTRRAGGRDVDVPYGVDFAFAFHAFHPEVAIIAD